MNFSLCEDTGFYLRMGLMGPSGSGKTFTALRIATEFGVENVGIIDTESRSARRYAKAFSKRFQSLELDKFGPQDYITALQTAEKEGIEFLVIDSLSHEWMGKGGVLDLADAAAKRSKGGNSFNAWREVTPEHNKLIDVILRAPMHLLVTMRTKTEYVVEQNDRGKSVPRKLGMAPIQREGLEYEFDIIGELDQDHNLIITKSRCPNLSREVMNQPGGDLALRLRNWVQSGKPTDWVDKIHKAFSLEELDSIKAQLNEEHKRIKFSADQLEQIRLAVDEAKQRLLRGDR